jgi:hypothetical protein
MKISKILLIAYSVIVIIIIWLIYDWMNPNYEKKFKQNSEEFAENRIHFEKLIKEINSEYLNIKQVSNLNEISKEVSQKYNEKLDEIGIENIEISFDEELNCSEKITYTFNVKSGYNIRTLNVVKIIYSPCDEQTEKDYHRNSYHIDINGEGNNWLIFSDTDFI